MLLRRASNLLGNSAKLSLQNLCTGNFGRPTSIKNNFCRTNGTSSATEDVYSIDPVAFEQAFSANDVNKLLSTFNGSDEKQLKSILHFTSVKSQNVIKHREKHGSFNSLIDLLSVPGIATLGLKKMCHAILNNEFSAKASLQNLSDASRVETSVGNLCHPKISLEFSKTINSIVSIDLQLDRMSWAHVDQSLYVIDWREDLIFQKKSLKYDHVHFMEKITSAVEKLPNADAYLFEGKTHRCSSLKLLPYFVTIQVIEALFMTLLNKTYSDSKKHNVFLIKPYIVSKHFGLMVGGERVSGQHVIRNIITGGDPLTESVTIPESEVDYFMGLSHIQQENLSRALLQAIAFNQLIIHKLRLQTDEL